MALSVYGRTGRKGVLRQGHYLKGTAMEQEQVYEIDPVLSAFCDAADFVYVIERWPSSGARSSATMPTTSRRGSMPGDPLVSANRSPLCQVVPCPLSRREIDMLRGLAKGYVYKQIAFELGLSLSTVRTHLHNAYGKLGVIDRAQAVLIATENGWI